MITIFYPHDTAASSIVVKLFDGIDLVATVTMSAVAGDRPYVWQGELNEIPATATLDFLVFENSNVRPAAWGTQSGFVDDAVLWLGQADGGVIVRSFAPSALAQLAGDTIVVSVPALKGKELSPPLVRGNSYLAAHGRSIDFFRNDFPDLPEGASVSLTATMERHSDNAFALVGSITSATGQKSVRFEPTSAQTRLWVPGKYRFEVKVEFPDTNIVSFVGPNAILNVLSDITTP